MRSFILLFVTALLYAGNGIAQPRYASPEAEEIVHKMIDAHGGYDAWKNLETQSFTSAMHSSSLGFVRFWIKSQTIHMKTRRSYQDWPLFGSTLTYDGKEAWATNWRISNPPNHQHSVYYYYVNLPWLTQEDHTVLGEVSKIKHPAFENEVYSIKMTFTESPILGKSKNDSYTLFIDSKSFLLNGYEYTVGYGPLLDVLKLPEDSTVFGPVLRINTYTGDVDGLKFPMLMTTHSTDLKQQYGDHAIYNYKLNGTFDETRMNKPENAVVDRSKDKRSSTGK
ncbi:hypothetical protein [Robertkochia flava]|uniref:hypothetical protein n=1 Tax=Robertkochia flava TaxID=3447986 RepID=UPI001CCA5BC6|nr:hypothetical protein [Robertkochia marina]